MIYNILNIVLAKDANELKSFTYNAIGLLGKRVKVIIIIELFYNLFVYLSLCIVSFRFRHQSVGHNAFSYGSGRSKSYWFYVSFIIVE